MTDVPDPATYIVRIWLPDRPGALGLVASRIGAVGGDVVAIEILERGGGMAVDDLTVQLRDPSLLDLLVAEVRQVDGAAVEDLRRVDPDRPDPGLLALSLSEGVLRRPGQQRLGALAAAVAELVEADWVVAVGGDDLRLLHTQGSAPDAEWLLAFVHGSRHLDTHGIESGDGTPGDLAWSHLPGAGIDVLCGRSGRVFHTRERQLLNGLARVVDVAGLDVAVAS